MNIYATRLRVAQLTFAIALLPVAFGGCGCDDDNPPPANPATITSFSASSMSVDEGDVVTLMWRVENAINVTITASPGGTLVDKSTNAMGTVVSSPLTQDTVFTLHAVGEGGNAMRMINVSVTQNPMNVAITQFDGSPLTIDAGQSSTLTYATRNATKVTIVEMGGATIFESTTELSGTQVVSPGATTTYVLTAEGEGGPVTEMVVIMVNGTPVITSFTANPTIIELGESSTLSWNVSVANSIIVRDSAGTAVYDGSNLQGSTTVTPAQTETYTLTARSAANIEATQMVTVTVNREAIIVSFGVSPTSVDYGDPAVLSWEVQRSTGVDIEANGVPLASTSSLTGTYTVTATETTDYRLIARNAAGDSEATVTLTVNPIAPRVVAFTVTPTVAQVGAEAELAWETIGASSIRIEDQDTNILFDGNDPSGAMPVDAVLGPMTFTLIATNPNGETRATVILTGQNTPVIDVFTVTPQTFVGAVTATITYSVSNAISTRLSIDGASAPGYVTTSTQGTYSFLATQTVTLTLEAVNDIGLATASLRLIGLAAEIEPNGDAASALPIAGDGTGAAGNIGPTGGTGGDLDWYAFTVPANGNVYAVTGDGAGGCNFDTYLSLIASDGTTVLGIDDDDGAGSCSEIDPRRDPFAANLAAGTYYLQVRGFGAGSIGDYVLLVTAEGPSCGNGIFEPGGMEQCDDGNALAADGCTALCAAEVAGMLMGPGMGQSFTGNLPMNGHQGFFAVMMLAEGYIRAETFIPTAGRCDTGSGSESADPMLTLYDANFIQLGTDDNDGIGSCALIDPRFDAFARVPAGTYYLRINETGNNATITNYVLDVVTTGIGCPNGILETGEDCDDGNSTAGDGCSALCAFEGLAEAEPNDTFATGTLLTGSPPYLVRGSITPGTDLDFYLVDVPAGYHVDAYITINSLDACSPDPTGQMAFYNTAGTLQGASNTTGGPGGNCGRVWPYTVTQTRAVTAGRYGIRVAESGNNAEIGTYYLHVNVIPPGCGNTILETGEACEDGNLAGGDGCSATCLFETPQVIDLSALGTTTIAGSITPSYNRDAVQIEVTATTYLRAETFVDAAAATCPSITTRLQLLASDQTTELGTDTVDGVGSCSLINPQTDAWARLAPGTYFLVTEENGNNAEIGAYQLVVRGMPVDVCGNTIIESAISEQCDDGNATSGDGCSSTCQLEPEGIVMGPPAGPVVFPGAIVPADDTDYYRLDLTAPGIIIAETFETAGVCATADTFLRLYDSTLTQIASDQDTGVGACSLISGLTTTAARVPAGTYWLRVEDSGLNTEIPVYEVHIEIRAQDVCGNGLRETGEACDDGNLTSGDGCSATCTIEPVGVVMGPPANLTFSGEIALVGEQDWYRLDLTADTILVAETGIPTVGVCATGDTYLRVFASDMTTEVAGDDDDGPGLCSFLNGVSDLPARLAAGTYFVRIEEFGNNATIAAYEVNIQLRPQNACGNGIVEGAELCDDGNLMSGDGCSPACLLEPSFTFDALPGAAMTFTGSLDTNTEVEVVQINVTTPIYVSAETFAPTAPDCATADTLIRLYTGTGVQLGTDDLDGVGSCSLINRTRDTFTRLTAGTYYITIEEDGKNATIGAYQIALGAAAADVCSDGILEWIGGEQCEDGNTADGDGCSATCQVEASLTFAAAPGAAVTFAGTLGANAEVDTVRIDVTAPIYIRAEAFAPSSPSCVTVDPFFRLFTSAGVQLGTDDLDGVNNCPLIQNTTDPWARLAAGTYFLTIEEDGLNAVVGAYEIALSATAADVCGNAIVEWAAGEQCEDGNPAGGDGCSATCTIETPTVVETEDNSTPLLANPLGTYGPGTFVDAIAGITPLGDLDFFTFTLTAPVNALINTYGVYGSTLTSCPGDTQLWLYNGVPTNLTATTVTSEPTLVAYDDDDGSGLCSLINGTETAPLRIALAAGTYIVQVRRFSNSATIPNYFVRFDFGP